MFTCRREETGVKTLKNYNNHPNVQNYSKALNTQLLIRYLIDGKDVGCQMVKIFKCYLDTGQMDAILFSYVLVWYLSGKFCI